MVSVRLSGVTLNFIARVIRAERSGLGPTWYIVIASDLRSVINVLFKLVDDTTLHACTRKTDIDLSVAFQHICCWAEDDHMITIIT